MPPAASIKSLLLSIYTGRCPKCPWRCWSTCWGCCKPAAWLIWVVIRAHQTKDSSVPSVFSSQVVDFPLILLKPLCPLVCRCAKPQPLPFLCLVLQCSCKEVLALLRSAYFSHRTMVNINTPVIASDVCWLLPCFFRLCSLYFCRTFTVVLGLVRARLRPWHSRVGGK